MGNTRQKRQKIHQISALRALRRGQYSRPTLGPHHRHGGTQPGLGIGLDARMPDAALGRSSCHPHMGVAEPDLTDPDIALSCPNVIATHPIRRVWVLAPLPTRTGQFLRPVRPHAPAVLRATVPLMRPRGLLGQTSLQLGRPPGQRADVQHHHAIAPCYSHVLSPTQYRVPIG